MTRITTMVLVNIATRPEWITFLWQAEGVSQQAHKTRKLHHSYGRKESTPRTDLSLSNAWHALPSNFWCGVGERLHVGYRSIHVSQKSVFAWYHSGQRNLWIPKYAPIGSKLLLEHPCTVIMLLLRIVIPAAILVYQPHCHALTIVSGVRRMGYEDSEREGWGEQKG